MGTTSITSLPIFAHLRYYHSHYPLMFNDSIYSKEPGQGRRLSQPPSMYDHEADLGFNFGTQDPLASSQRSSLFPWDNAGVGSSSSGAFGPAGSDRISFDRAEIKLRGSSLSRRESSLIPSQIGSARNSVGFSPGAFGKDSQIIGEDYVFESECCGRVNYDRELTLKSSG